MKLILLITTAFLTIAITNAQTFTTNTTPVGMEHNILFNAITHYKVTQTGTAQLNLSYLFDGRFGPSYTSTAPIPASPTVVLIEDLPAIHVQTGAWVGWSTRYWEARNFKIEGYNTYNGANEWVNMADYSVTNYTGGRKFSVKVPGSRVYTKLRFTFYSAVGTDGRLGVSELFYIHPEATAPYANLGLGNWSKKDNILSSTAPEVKVNDLSVNGILDTKGVDITGITRRLDSGWAETDFNWVGHSLIFGTKPNTYAHNVIEMRPGGADRGELASIFKMHQAKSEGVQELRVQIDSRTSSPTFFNAGNVGIGTTTPKNKLSVNGTIWATKVKVTLTDAADWVFEDDYNLRPLSEVANFIKIHKHLPEIPSADEFRANDMEISEMTNKLLQKIEELTLYAIEQEKENKALETKFEIQQKENKGLEARLAKLEALLVK